MSRSKRILLFWLRSLCFLLLLLLVLGYSLYVLTPKQDYGICSMTNLYQQDRDTVDVLVIGTSAAQAAINTSLLWEEYGIAAYDLCSAELPYWVSYYYLCEALKTQSPRLLILDAKPAIYSLPYSRKGRVILSTYGIRSLENRLGAIAASTHPDNTVNFVLGFPIIHDNYPSLTRADFHYPPDNGGRGTVWKGFIGYEGTLDFQPPYLETWTDEQTALPDRQQAYLEKILRLAQERAIPVLIIGFPTPDYAHDHPYFNSVGALAEAWQADFLNYNHPAVNALWDYSADFADWQHLNLHGSAKLTRHLGICLAEDYALPDRRGQSAYMSYEAHASAWLAQYGDHPLMQGMLD